jgi:hypothetical protein
MLKDNIDNDFNIKKNDKLKVTLFRYSYFYSLLKLRKKIYISFKDRFNSFKLIKIIK